MTSLVRAEMLKINSPWVKTIPGVITKHKPRMSVYLEHCTIAHSCNQRWLSLAIRSVGCLDFLCALRRWRKKQEENKGKELTKRQRYKQRERERERGGGETDRQTDRQTDGQADRQTDR